MVLDHERDHPSRWAAVVFMAEKIGCVPQTLYEWVKKIDVDSVWTNIASKSYSIKEW